MINDLAGNAVESVAADIRAAGGTVASTPGDIGDRSTAQALLRRRCASSAQLDILVNNAGVLRDRMIFSMSPDEWDLVLRTHLRGHFLTSRAATAYWREAEQADRRPGLRPDREHLVGGIPARLVRAAELLGGQGRDHRADR